MSDSRMIGGLATGILVIALLYFGQSVFVPLAFSLFLIALVWPLQAALQRRLPKLLALLLTLSFTALVLIVIGSLTAWAFGKLAQWFVANAGRFRTIYAEQVAWLEEHGIAIVGPLTDHFDVAWFISLLQTVAGRLNSLTGAAALVLLFVMIGLLEVDDFKARLRLSEAQPHGRKILSANREIGAKLRRFMIVRSFAAVLTGMTVWGFALLAGLELAAAWGAIAFTLNFIPFLGPLIATVLPTLFATGQFESWQSVIVFFTGLTIIQFLIGSYLEPLLAGASLKISPFAVVVAVFFWSFLWGLGGAFIGVPMLIAFIIYCGQYQSSRWIAALLSVGPAVPSEGGAAR